jgi:hypothetical protein
MYHYRQALVRMRQGESNRQIHATGLMGRRTLGSLRKQAEERGWSDADHPLPPDAELAEVLQSAKPAHAGVHSSLEPYRVLIEKWSGEGIDGTTIHAAPWLHRQLLFLNKLIDSCMNIQKSLHVNGFFQRLKAKMHIHGDRDSP